MINQSLEWGIELTQLFHAQFRTVLVKGQAALVCNLKAHVTLSCIAKMGLSSACGCIPARSGNCGLVLGHNPAHGPGAGRQRARAIGTIAQYLLAKASHQSLPYLIG